ncbi:pyruvate dehydrogenase (acetyl-transferring) E1 component, alpha subunit [Pneumocystis jirovecii RU7]|uniref:Pyruvate dehydrogenase E1 component subunit alpha n=1 Tax=Pneumocystis jirovecii (strain RU7) TaxID=1408657 RepID=A0A0W4ZRH9_PNEJ7|nr:pyruvate dehydrogenase (acetyl-transferring) E1 component, alpha subunit [Pneumocystis jirovecii RU7]KTW30942.1 pyruvate dehydrogenase (acetyl-transferring) E1 component, alpha subunit [Pneumocystis jirovecii RU7]
MTRFLSKINGFSVFYGSCLRGTRSISISSPALEKLKTRAEDEELYHIKLPEKAFQAYDIDCPSLDVVIGKKELLKIYYNMVVIRRMETASDLLYKSKKIRGFCHLSIGQEAVAVGIEHAITPEDQVITSYRCHGFAYIRGVPVRSIIAELLGRVGGASRGKGGSMHIFGKNFYGGNGIVGAQVPVGAGIAFAMKYLNKPNTTFALYGDGAANQGQVFEAFNMAKLWNIPVVFGCENNKYGMGTSAERSSAMVEYYKRGQYIPGIQVDGMNVLAVKQASAFVKEYTLKNGPIVMEILTYRYGGHSMSDPGTTYRTREEIQHVRSTNDCISGLKDVILDLNAATESELKDIEKNARTFVDKEVKHAEESEFPSSDPAILFSDIYLPGTNPETFRGRWSGEVYFSKDILKNV